MRRFSQIGMALLTAVAPALWACGEGAPAGGAVGGQDAAELPPADGGAGDAAAPDGDAALDDAGGDDDAGRDPGPPADGGDAGGADGAAGCEVGAPAGPLQVATHLGRVAGSEAGGVRRWLGIPYAAPPTGDRRWRPPVDPACYAEPLAAAAFGPACPQLQPQTQQPFGDEDCLTLNVWAPADAAAGPPRPVLFFIHGGGNIQGSAGAQLPGGVRIYDGRHLASRHGVVVVTLNYRLGALGYLTLPELAQRSAQGVSGNYGILDQLHGLAWVQRNIAAFGGDPGRVMVFGESAGAVNTCTLLASPLAAGLFHRALMQSGGCGQPPLAVVEAAHSGKVDAGPCGGAADRLACLQGLTAVEVLEALPGATSAFGASLQTDFSESYGPVVDGWVLEVSPFVAIETGAAHAVPFAIGSNADELAALATFEVQTEAQYQGLVTAIFGLLGVADELLAVYPASAYPSPQDAMVALLGDMRFTCPARRIARARAGAGAGPVYRYWFTRRPVTPQGEQPAAHGAELLYVFGTLNDFPVWTPGPDDQATLEALMAYWTRFAASGDPSDPALPAWPPYDAATDRTQELTATPQTVEGVRTAECDTWDAIFDLLAP